MQVSTLYVPLVAKLLLLFGLPVAIGVFWQRRLRTHWNILALASLAFLVYYAAMKLLNPITSQFDEVLEPVPGLNHQWEHRIAIQTSLSVMREGIKWLTLRFATEIPFIAKRNFSWQDGVMLGITYGCIAMLVSAGSLSADIYNQTIALNEFTWQMALIASFRWAVIFMVFNVGTFLIVAFSVQRRAILPFIAAVLWNVLMMNSIPIYLYLAILAIGLGQILRHVPDLIEIQAGAFVIAMLCLIPIFLLRKPMTEKRST